MSEIMRDSFCTCTEYVDKLLQIYMMLNTPSLPIINVIAHLLPTFSIFFCIRIPFVYSYIQMLLAMIIYQTCRTRMDKT